MTSSHFDGVAAHLPVTAAAFDPLGALLIGGAALLIAALIHAILSPDEAAQEDRASDEKGPGLK